MSRYDDAVDEVRKWLRNLQDAKNWQAIGTIKSAAHAQGQEQALYHQLRDEGERWLRALASPDEPNPEWERIEKMSDEEVKAELIADGTYKDEADIAEHAAKFTLRVHEMLRMKKAGERIGREKLAATMKRCAEAEALLESVFVPCLIGCRVGHDVPEPHYHMPNCPSERKQAFLKPLTSEAP